MEYFLKWIDAKIAAVLSIPARMWAWVDGKKTTLSSLYWFGVQTMIPVWFAAGIPDPWDKIIYSVGAALTFIGLGHKAVKGAQKK